MRSLINKLTIGAAIVAIVFTPSRVCNAVSNRSGRMELGASAWFLGGESISEGGVKTSEDDWSFYGAVLGTNVNEHLNVNTEIIYGSVDVGVSGLPAGSSVSGDQDTFVWLINLDYNIFDEPLTPYITGGLGWGYSEGEVKWRTPGSSGKIDFDTDGFAYTAGVGGRWDIAENIVAKVSYRILWDDEGDDRDGIGISVAFLFD